MHHIHETTRSPSVDLAHRIASVVALFGLVAVAGCSGGGDDGGGGTTGGTSGSTGPGTATAATTGSTTADTTGTTAATAGSDTGTAGSDTGTVGSDTGTGGSDTGTGGSTGGAGLEIAGTYLDEWGTDHTITDDTWTMDFGGGMSSVFHVLSYDNDADFLVAQNDAQNDYNPGLYSRFDWTMAMGSLWYCQTVFDAMTAADAENAPAADPTDPSTGGCGGFPWTNLTP